MVMNVVMIIIKMGMWILFFIILWMSEMVMLLLMSINMVVRFNLRLLINVVVMVNSGYKFNSCISVGLFF